MEDINTIRGRLEEIGLTQGQIDDVLPLLVDEEQAPTEQEVPVLIEELKSQMALEPDYKKRASMAARIISLSLEN